ncbi:hypothetical protein Q5762_18050 [Streptomyces sp. P9(2023)]|uniref:hypothetical protein n=1 Tax=Streptomyces sp. P9(2023) TaxID=3064394 RepID=UPI0028F3E403|nr:hypothetical protein [Streptomyces sp. P9(2023)]MDT9690209.1 hypothetical protein [Streptomyces sp. P9(2023)]
MSLWPVYTGSSEPHDGIDALPAPPPWRAFDGGPALPQSPGTDARGGSPGGMHRAQTYRPTGETVQLVNAALYLRRPLLVTGPPGSGKSSLPYAVARELGLGGVLHELVERRDSLDRPAEASPGWLMISQPHAAPRLSAEHEELVAELARGILGGPRGRPPGRGGRGLVRTPLPPRNSAEFVVEWAVDTFPRALARQLPPDALSQVRLNVVVHEDSEAAASALGDAAGVQVADAGRNVLVVTVLISHGLRARLPRARQRDFGRITATAGGWQHVVVVEPPGGDTDGAADRPALPSGAETPFEEAPEAQPDRGRGWLSGLAARLTGGRDEDEDEDKGLPKGLGPVIENSGTVVGPELAGAPGTDPSEKTEKYGDWHWPDGMGGTETNRPG